jgi:hypothetical protein
MKVRLLYYGTNKCEPTELMLQFLETNVVKKEAEKILKYKDIITEIQRMWNVKARVIPVIIGATGTGNNRGDWNHFKIR